MLLEVTPKSNVTVIKIKAKALDQSNINQFRLDMMKLYNAGNRSYIFDFSEVNFIDSSGIGALLFFHKAINETGLICICHVKPEVKKLLQLLHLQRLMHFFNNLEDALEQFQTARQN